MISVHLLVTFFLRKLIEYFLLLIETIFSTFSFNDSEMISRRSTIFEQCPFTYDIYVQLALRYSSKKEVMEAAKFLQETAIGCRCGTDFHNVYALKEKVPIMEFPNIENLNEAAVFCANNRTPNPRNGLACVCVNDDTVVLNSSHACADGGYLIEMNKLLLGQKSYIDKKMPYPIPIEHAVLDDMLDVQGPPVKSSTPINTNPLTWTIPQRKTKVSHTRFVADYQSLKCYDFSLKKPIKITDAFWSSLVMSAFAFNGQTTGRFGTITCVNMRPYIKNLSLDNADAFSQMGQTVAVPDENETVGSVCERFRANFNENKKDIFRNIRAFNYDVKNVVSDYVGLELSNVGTFQAKGPIKDLYAGLSMQEMGCLSEICLLTYTLERDHSKECIGQVRYPVSRISPHDAWMMSESMKFFLQNIPLSSTVKDAVEKIRNFQQNYKYSPDILYTI